MVKQPCDDGRLMHANYRGNIVLNARLIYQLVALLNVQLQIVLIDLAQNKNQPFLKWQSP